MIDVEGLTKFYDDRPAIQDITFSVPRGQVVGFLGPDGAGKSTTMRILAGSLGANAGRATVAGYDVFDRSLEARSRVGYLPEGAPLYDEMRVTDYLEMVCRLRGLPPSKRADAIDRAIELCGLDERSEQVIGRLSRGLRQRVGLAQAIVHHPEVLILDEPTAGLDPAQARETRDLIKTLGIEHTVILSSHILPEVAATCQRVLIISQGRIVADDTPEGLALRLTSGHGNEVAMLVRGPGDLIRLGMSSIRGIDELEVTPAGDGLWRVVIKSKSLDLREDMARVAIESGFGVRELQARTLSLEDVFLRLTTEELK